MISALGASGPRRADRSRARPAPPAAPPARPPTAPPVAGQPSPIRLGYHCPLNSERVGAPLLSNTERHILLFGLNGAGKSTRFLIELLMTTSNRSLPIFDLKGELAYQTGTERERIRRYITSTRTACMACRATGSTRSCSILLTLCFSASSPISARLRLISRTKTRTGTQSSASLLEGFTGWEIITARREKRLPSLANVRRMVCEADRFENVTDAAGKKQRQLVGGITYTTEKIYVRLRHRLRALSAASCANTD